MPMNPPPAFPAALLALPLLIIILAGVLCGLALHPFLFADELGMGGGSALLEATPCPVCATLAPTLTPHNNPVFQTASAAASSSPVLRPTFTTVPLVPRPSATPLPRPLTPTEQFASPTIEIFATVGGQSRYRITAPLGLRLRSQPSTGAGVVSNIPLGEVVIASDVIEIELPANSGRYWRWGQTTYSGVTGWFAIVDDAGRVYATRLGAR